MNIQRNQRNETSKIHTDCALRYAVIAAFRMSTTIVKVCVPANSQSPEPEASQSLRPIHYGKLPSSGIHGVRTPVSSISDSHMFTNYE